jgi:K(+)-stimulated pyrophosphate-energized sodium pump
VTVISISICTGIFALLFAMFIARRVLQEDQGTEAMKDIGKAIQEGASAFLTREYLTLAVFVLVVSFVIGIFIDIMQLGKSIPETGISYLFGAICSAVTGFFGMSIAVRANTRTAAAAMKGLNPGLRVAFNSGTVMGVTVVGIGIIGISVLYVIFKDISVVAGFSFGASTIALFARVGGGIFTKAADVGSDIVGKVEAGIPEDDPRNPATIADNVGDNVGDVAGMGSDLFESYSSSIIATMAIATAATAAVGGVIAFDAPKLVLPLLIAAVGILSSVVGTFFVRTKPDASMSQLLWALRRGIYISSALVLGSSYAAIQYLGIEDGNRIFLSIVTGLVAGNVIGFATEYYTSYEYSPTRKIAEAAQTGAGTTIISGFATGMLSTLVPVIAVVASIMIAFWAADLYGVAIAAVGMLSTLGITLATDAYGPVADNAGGIAEQAHLDPEVRERTDALDSLGNTTAATGKGFAIGSAALTSLALLSAYAFAITPQGQEMSINILDPNVLVGLFIGALLPFIFSALTMQAVGTAAYAIVNEVRRQFREIPGIMEGTGRPDYARCVDISTKGSLRAMILPGAMAVIAPIAMGLILGPEPLGGMLVGAIAAGFLLAVTMANSGGAWDNAKKYIEAGHFDGKGSETHKAAVTGDTVGDPFKDTSGPALNILIKLMSIVALVFAPLFV